MGEKAFDFKRAYKDLYMPKDEPELIEVPSMNFLMVDGNGDPNNNPEFRQATGRLFRICGASPGRTVVDRRGRFLL